jgi:hypothetical protein
MSVMQVTIAAWREAPSGGRCRGLPAGRADTRLTGIAGASLKSHAGKMVDRIGEGMPMRWRIVS